MTNYTQKKNDSKINLASHTFLAIFKKFKKYIDAKFGVLS